MAMSDTSINDFNLQIRQSDWYQNWFASKGLDPNKVKLDEKQRAELKGLVEQHTGFKLPGDMKIDPAGNLNEKGGWAGLPTGVKVALIAAAAAGTAGAAGLLGGGAAAGGSAAGGGAAAATPAATAAGTAAATGGGMGAGTLGTIAATTGAAARGLSTMDKISAMLGVGGRAIGSATEAAAQSRMARDQNERAAYGANIQGENAFQSQQLAQAREEAAQRDEARKALYRASVMKNPGASVENPRGAPSFSPEMLEGLTNLEKQALARTADSPQYTTAKMRAPRDFAPLDPKAMVGASRPSTMETIGNWLAPGLSIADLAFKVF